MRNMTTETQFARFSPKGGAMRLTTIPEGGFCLSAFLVISKTSDPNKVLLGHINPDAPWDKIGALDPGRVLNFQKGLMLPSSHLIYGESPQNAALRIAQDQLGVKDLELSGPLVFSEVYRADSHWDLEFLFLGKREEAPSTTMWKQLEFMDVTKLKREDLVREQADILAHAGKFKGD